MKTSVTGSFKFIISLLLVLLILCKADSVNTKYLLFYLIDASDRLLTINETGLDMCEQFMDVNEMIGDEDLIEQKSNVHANGVGNRLYANYSPHHIQQFVSRMVPRVAHRRPSARELNLLKRKAKISSKDQAKGNCEGADVEMSSSHASTSKRTLSDSMDSNKVFGYSILVMTDNQLVEFEL